MDKINCMSWVNDPGDTPERYWEINIDGKVWPCCHYVVESYQTSEKNTLLKDKDYLEAIERDPNWNDLNFHSLQDIINHDYYTKSCSPCSWKSGNAPPLCIKLCSNYTLEGYDSGKEVTTVKAKK